MRHGRRAWAIPGAAIAFYFATKFRFRREPRRGRSFSCARLSRFILFDCRGQRRKNIPSKCRMLLIGKRRHGRQDDSSSRAFDSAPSPVAAASFDIGSSRPVAFETRRRRFASGGTQIPLPHTESRVRLRMADCKKFEFERKKRQAAILRILGVMLPQGAETASGFPAASRRELMVSIRRLTQCSRRPRKMSSLLSKLA